MGVAEPAGGLAWPTPMPMATQPAMPAAAAARKRRFRRELLRITGDLPVADVSRVTDCLAQVSGR
jgi:hypothetical protein